MKNIWLCLLVMLAMIVNTSCTTLMRSVGAGLSHCMRAKNYFDREADVELAKAVAGSNSNKMQKCLDNGANINAVGREGMTPLVWSVYKNSKSGFVFLLQHGANPNLVTTRYDGDKMSVMEEITTFRETDFLRLALENGVSPNSPSGNNRTVLFGAIMFSNLENVRVLVEAGANINHKGSFMETPLITASAINRYDMVYYLLSEGADPNLKDKANGDLFWMIKLYGDRGISSREQHDWYQKVLKKLNIREDEIRRRDESYGDFEKRGRGPINQ